MARRFYSSVDFFGPRTFIMMLRFWPQLFYLGHLVNALNWRFGLFTCLSLELITLLAYVRSSINVDCKNEHMYGSVSRVTPGTDCFERLTWP